MILYIPLSSQTPEAKESFPKSLLISDLAITISSSLYPIFLVGAGISTSSGIRDFKSFTRRERELLRFEALRSRAEEQREMFDEMRRLASNAKRTKTHEFMNVMSRRGRLGRVYTQNIDGLEEGLVPDDKVVRLHGSLKMVRCRVCEWQGDWKRDRLDCPICEERSAQRLSQQKRSTCSTTQTLRPSIILYDEPLPLELSTHISNCVTQDLPKADLVIVMGTSLRIPGFVNLVKEFAQVVKKQGGKVVCVNEDKVGGKRFDKVFDYFFLAKTDDFVERILKDWGVPDIPP